MMMRRDYLVSGSGHSREDDEVEEDVLGDDEEPKRPRRTNENRSKRHKREDALVAYLRAAGQPTAPVAAEDPQPLDTELVEETNSDKCQSSMTSVSVQCSSRMSDASNQTETCMSNVAVQWQANVHSPNTDHNYAGKRNVYSDTETERVTVTQCGTHIAQEDVVEVQNEGSQLTLKLTCTNNCSYRWQAQPYLCGTKGAGNLLLTASVFFSGIHFSKFERFCNSMNLKSISVDTYAALRKKFVFLAVKKAWTNERSAVLSEMTSQEVALCGDGRCDSPGHSAKYCTYTFLDTQSSKVVDFKVVSVTQVSNSNAMELHGFKEALKAIEENGVQVSTISTDRHPQIVKEMRVNNSEKVHQFDLWHVAKGVSKKLTAEAKRKGAQSCEEDAVLLKEKWVSAIHHVTNRHDWPGNRLYHCCAHEPLDEESQRNKLWLKPRSEAHCALVKIVTDKRLLKDLDHLTKCIHTTLLEVYHSMYLKYLPKRTHFGSDVVVHASMLAALDHNNNVNREQAVYQDGESVGEPKYKISWSKVHKTFRARPAAVGKDYSYSGGKNVLPQQSEPSVEMRFFGNLFSAAAERERQTGEKILELLSTVCRSKFSPLKEIWTDFLLDLYSYHINMNPSLLPSLQSVFQSSPSVWFVDLSEKKSSILLEVLKLQPEKKRMGLTGWSHEESEVRSLLECLPYISQLSVIPQLSDPSGEIGYFVNLIRAAAERERWTGQKILYLLSSVCTYKAIPLQEVWCDFLLDLYSYQTKTGLSLLPSLQSVFQSTPPVWSINLSERKSSILLEVLKLQPEKKQLEILGWSDEESEVRSFLQCLPYISQLSVGPQFSEETMLLGHLISAAAEREKQTGEKILELLSSVCRYKTDLLRNKWSDFLLDLFSHVKDYQTKTGLSLLPSLQSVFQSAPSVWSINLSERKSSILLEVLKLHPEKKPVELKVCSPEESEVRSFLQCLPYISQLRIDPSWRRDAAVRLFVDLISAAAEREEQTGEKILELLSSVCRYETFPYDDRYWDDDYYCFQSDFLLDLFSHVKDYQTKTGLSLLPSLQSVFQSAPSVWSIKLSERKSSILLEVLKLHPEKKPVELKVCSPEESEVRSFLQCLPYISQLRIDPSWSRDAAVRLFVDLISAAAEREEQTGEKILKLLSSVCRYKTDILRNKWGDFLLDLYSHVKDYQTKTGLSLLPSLQSVFQSAPSVWSINLSERKSSILLEVLKLHPEKKPVELKVCSPEESEVRSFLQCLPYISQLRIDPSWSRDAAVRLFIELISAAAEREEQTGEKILELLSSVCREMTPLNDDYWDGDDDEQSDFLLDLFSHVKDYQTKTGLSLLPSLQSVFQSAPSVWSIKLSERKSSILLEVLKLHPEKKPVKLKVCSPEESEVRSFLQCLPYISHLR
ncbi:uncharacterized protein KZ484_019176 [Pholidichthys leucotaenia]